MSYDTYMKDKKPNYGKQITFRLPPEEYQKVLKLLGPYGAVAPFIRDLIRQRLLKAEKTNAA